MSSPSRRSNDYSALRGSGRSPNSVGRSSSQPPQPFQPPTTISGTGTHGGTASSAPWANRPPSNVQGNAPGQVPAAAQLYGSHTQPSGVEWDYMSLDVSHLIDSAQLQPQQQQITVPELYPTPFPTTSTTSASRGQYENPQSRDRLQQSTPWSGVSHLSTTRPSLQPTSQPPQDVPYTAQPQYRQTQNKDPQNYPPQGQQQQPSSSAPRPRNNQSLGSNQISPLSQPVAPPNTSQGAQYSSQYNPPPSTSQHTRARSSDYEVGRLPVAQRPPPSPNRQNVSLRPARPGEGEGMPDRWGSNSGGMLSSSVPIAPRPSAPQPAVTNSVRPPPPRLPPQTLAPVPRPPSVPTCLIPGCREQVVKDLRTNQLTEYCGEAHMSEALSRHGVRVCPACKKFPRRTGSEYCGTSCEQWAAEQRQKREEQQQQQRLQQQRQGQQLQPQQQQHSQQRQGQQLPVQPQQPQHNQQRQGQQQPQQHQRPGQQLQQQPQQQRQGQQHPPAANPYPIPNSGSVTWTNVAGGPTSSNNVSSPHGRQGSGQFNW